MFMSDLTPEATMEIARTLILIEIGLAVLALIIAFIRACGPGYVKRWISDCVAATVKFMHLPISH